MPTFFEQDGVSIVAKESIVSASGNVGVVDDSLEAKISSYSHKISANNGYDSASMELTLDPGSFVDWLYRGVGRHIEVYGSSGDQVWEGFVNKVTASINQVSVSVGPLVEIANEVKVNYSTVRYNTNPPIGGQEASTDVAQNTTSISEYGYFRQTVDGSEGTLEQMESLRDRYLNQYAYPKTSRSISSGNSSGSSSIKLECLGYVHLLKGFTYTSTSTGVLYPDVLIAAVLAAEPNGLFSTPNDNLVTNTSYDMSQYYNEDESGYDVIKKTISLGGNGAPNGRHTFGIYENRRAEYQWAHSHVTYYYNVATGEYLDTNGGRKKPYEVVAARWIRLIGFPAQVDEANLLKDISAVYAESVTYTAPASLSVVGAEEGIGVKIDGRGIGGSF